MFIDASREFVAGTQQNALNESHLTRIVETYQARETVEKYAYRASREKIAENDFNLNIPRFVDTFEEEDEIDLMAVREERTRLKADLAELETRMEGYLRELGLWCLRGGGRAK